MKLRFPYRFLVLAVIVLTTSSCELFQKRNEAKVIAKVHNENLYENDLKNFNIPSGLSEKDSIAVLVDYINDWATKQLIMHEAKKNMSEKKQIEYNNLVESYKLDLFSSAYENAYVKKNLKTAVTESDIESYYSKFKESFLLQKDLINVRYIELSKKYKDVAATKKAFSRFKDDDINELNKIKLSFISSDFNFNEEWVSLDSFLEKIPSLKKFKKTKLLVNGKLLSYKNNESRFLIKFKAVLKSGSPAPIKHVKDQIKQIILNKRKIQLKKQLEEEIRKDALQTKEYQIFE